MVIHIKDSRELISDGLAARGDQITEETLVIQTISCEQIQL